MGNPYYTEQLEDRVNELERKLEDKDTDIQALDEKNGNLQDEVNSLNDKLKEIEGYLDNLGSELSMLLSCRIRRVLSAIDSARSDALKYLANAQAVF